VDSLGVISMFMSGRPCPINVGFVAVGAGSRYFAIQNNSFGASFLPDYYLSFPQMKLGPVVNVPIPVQKLYHGDITNATIIEVAEALSYAVAGPNFKNLNTVLSQVSLDGLVWGDLDTLVGDDTALSGFMHNKPMLAKYLRFIADLPDDFSQPVPSGVDLFTMLRIK